MEPYNEYEGTGTGFSFCNYNAHEMLRTIQYALSVYYGKRADWKQLVEQGMQEDFSWRKSAKKYEDLYQKITC